MRLLFQYILLFLYSALYVAGLELVRYDRRFWWVVLVSGAVLLFALMWYLCKRKINWRLLQFSLAPLIFYVAGFWFAMFLQRTWIYHTFAILGAVVFWMYFEQALLYFHYPLKYFPYTLENFAYYMGLLAFFFLVSGLFGFAILLQLKVWFLAVLAALGTFIINFEIFWNQKIELRKSRIFNFVITLIVVEFFVALGFLPTGYYVNAAVLSIFYYVLMGLSKSALTGYLTRRSVLMHVFIAAACLLLVLFSAQWI